MNGVCCISKHMMHIGGHGFFSFVVAVMSAFIFSNLIIAAGICDGVCVMEDGQWFDWIRRR
jgi:hypothetical protein